MGVPLGRAPRRRRSVGTLQDPVSVLKKSSARRTFLVTHGHQRFWVGQAKPLVRGYFAHPRRVATVSRPIGGVLSSAEAPGWPSIYAAYLGMPPPGRRRAGSPFPHLALLRVGFAEPPGFPRTLVRSYRTVSPLPVVEPVSRPGPSAVCFLWHFPAGRPDWPLASTLPSGAPTFLDTVGEPPCRGHPAGSPSFPVCT